MKILTLIRHAKSSWKHPELTDFDRPLNRRGREDAPRMGRRLAGRNLRPDLLIASPALRARRTAELIAAELDYPAAAIVFEPRLYLAAPDTVRSVVAACDDGLGHVAVVAHNPGLTELCNGIGNQPLDNLPTAGVYSVELAEDSWAEAAWSRGRLVLFDAPKQGSD